ncbi:MAG: glycine cleavage T C-terminal barrel domain-containing protein, partial [Paracoccaceae bacterium]
ALDSGDFIGRNALQKAKAKGPKRRLTTLAVDGYAPFLSGETVLCDGKVVGSLTSAGYGHHLGQTIGYAYLPVDLSDRQEFEIEAFGSSYRARRGPRCLYDPKQERLKA